jgi:hypothetical protein
LHLSTGDICGGNILLSPHHCVTGSGCCMCSFVQHCTCACHPHGFQVALPAIWLQQMPLADRIPTGISRPSDDAAGGGGVHVFTSLCPGSQWKYMVKLLCTCLWLHRQQSTLSRLYACVRGCQPRCRFSMHTSSLARFTRATNVCCSRRLVSQLPRARRMHWRFLGWTYPPLTTIAGFSQGVMHPQYMYHRSTQLGSLGASSRPLLLCCSTGEGVDDAVQRRRRPRGSGRGVPQAHAGGHWAGRPLHREAAAGACCSTASCPALDCAAP